MLISKKQTCPSDKMTPPPKKKLKLKNCFVEDAVEVANSPNVYTVNLPVPIN
jgi:hypothetical protein